MFPAACETCGLFRSAQSYCIAHEVDQRTYPELQTRPWALFLLPWPRGRDDLHATVATPEDNAGKFLRQWLDQLETRWILSYGVRCYGGRGADDKDVKPTDVQQQLCARQFLAPIIRDYDPLVVVCLGAPAMKSLLGTNAPPSLQQAGKKPFRIPGLEDRWCICTYEPVCHVSGNKDLRQEYWRVWQDVESLCKDQRKVTNITWETVASPSRAMEIARQLPYHVSLDVETGCSAEDPSKMTVWHPNAVLICCSLTVKVGDEYRTWVLIGAALCREVLQVVVAGRLIYGSGIKYDVQALWVFLGVDCLALCAGLYCLVLASWAPDQSRLKNGLKTLADEHYGAGKYNRKVWAQVEEANKVIHDRNALVGKANTSRMFLRRRCRMPANPTLEMVLQWNWDRMAEGWHQWVGLDDLLPLPMEPENADLRDAKLDDVVEYCAHDTYYSARIYFEVMESRPAEQKPHPTLWTLLDRAMHSLVRIERVGLPMDRDKILRLRDAKLRRLELIRKHLLQQPEIHEALALMPNIKALQVRGAKGQLHPEELAEKAAEEMNPRGKIFIEHLCDLLNPEAYQWIPRTKKTRQPSMNDDVLERLAGLKDKVKPADRTRAMWIWYYILQARQIENMLSKFLDSFPDYVVDGRIHTSYTLAKVEKAEDGGSGGADASAEGAGTTSGRTASRDPALQNVIGDTQAKSCSEAPEGWEFVEFDYSQIEPVVLTHIADIKAWRKVYQDRQDIYRIVANGVYNIGVDTTMEDIDLVRKLLKEMVSDGQRKLTKTGVLAVMYNQKAAGLAARLGIPVEEAEEFLVGFDLAFPEVKVYKDMIWDRISNGLPVTTPFGRCRTFTLIGKEGVDQATFREAINFPIQSTASDITLWKSYELFQWLDRMALNDAIQPCNMVHDSIWFIMKKGYRQRYLMDIATLMEDMSTLPLITGPFSLPLRGACKVGQDLGHMEEMTLEQAVAA